VNPADELNANPANTFDVHPANELEVNHANEVEVNPADELNANLVNTFDVHPANELEVNHYIQKLIFDGWCKLIKIQSKMNTADMATKILPANAVSVFSKIVLGMHDDLPLDTDTD
jgi:hypothetical protein